MWSVKHSYSSSCHSVSVNGAGGTSDTGHARVSMVFERVLSECF